MHTDRSDGKESPAFVAAYNRMIGMDFIASEPLGGTWRQGFLTATYQDLVAVFGEPEQQYDEKVQVEWCLTFTDGTVATIYDYRDCSYPESITNWHIGGRCEDAVARVMEAMAEALEEAVACPS